MALMDLDDRISWEQAVRILGVSKSSFFRLVKSGRIPGYGNEARCRFYLRSDCRAWLENRRAKKR